MSQPRPIDPIPVTLRLQGIRLEPLSPTHAPGLAAAAADGALWELRVASVPAPGDEASYIATALMLSTQRMGTQEGIPCTLPGGGVAALVRSSSAAVVCTAVGSSRDGHGIGLSKRKPRHALACRGWGQCRCARWGRNNNTVPEM